MTAPVEEVKQTAPETQNSVSRPTLISPIFDRFPPELTRLPNWVLWKLLPPKSGGSKWRKVPFQADGTPASTTDRATWSTLDRCRAVYDRGGYDGVGFVFDGAVGGDGLCFVGVDFDKCVLTAPGTKSQTSSIARARIKVRAPIDCDH